MSGTLAQRYSIIATGMICVEVMNEIRRGKCLLEITTPVVAAETALFAAFNCLSS